MVPAPTLTLEGLFDDLENITPVLKQEILKKVPVLEKPGNWDTKITGGSRKARPDYKENGQPTSKIQSSLAKAFPNGKLLADRPDVLRCIHCRRPVLKHAMPAHIEGCLNKKQEKQRKKKEAKDARDAAARKEKSQGDSDASGDEEGGKKTTRINGMTASKKRKASDEADEAGPNKKKKKKDLDKNQKSVRPKAPVDVERQCGVDLPQGGQCARSLTCKSHSMGAKRSVPGRSAPYDKLLLEYQRRNAAKEAKAKIDASAPDPEDEENAGAGPVDVEEETAAVMAGIARGWGGAPIYDAPRVPLRSRYELNRMRNALDSGMGSRIGGERRTGIFGGGGAPRDGVNFFTGLPRHIPTQAVDNTTGTAGAGGERRGSVIPASARTLQASRKASLVMAS
ncbi:hypothetical protein LTR62_006170 [Meristemomyces frigidus]|uniref:SCA7 domain-containing protein n=1 Tax=Meristemomyces frigidus TaxID=1508187 RepID=A0AAN7TCC4_9PEZI|nr:hypothetical protein LTR62_006170 [Meristemomyces frigidus]